MTDNVRSVQGEPLLRWYALKRHARIHVVRYADRSRCRRVEHARNRLRTVAGSESAEDARSRRVLVNLVRAGAGVRTIVRFYYQHKTDATWATESTQAAMQRVGAEFLSKKSYDDALLVFQINFRDYPTSLLDEINVVHRALSVDPTNPELANLAKKLDEMQRSPPH